MSGKSFASNSTAAGLLLAVLAASTGAPARADEPVSLDGKTVTIIVGSETGGTSDASGRLIAGFLAKYLPGKPNVIVQNRPGAHNLTAMNYFVQQVKPDGLTLTLGSGSQLDPGNYRIPQSHYDPATFLMVGGVDLGGAVLIARVDALPRLTNKSMAPLVMGSPSGMPHNTMLPVAWGIEYLGWNARWVSGYPSPTAALALAIERGETDLTAFNTSGFTGGLLDKSKFKVLYQTGSNRCSAPSSLPTVQGVPLFVDAMRGKIADPVAQKAFEYWCNSSSIGTWIALPPGTPQPIVDVYRESYRKAAADPAFLKQGKNISDDISVVTYDSLTSTARFNGSVSTDVMEVIPNLLRKQGLVVN